MTREKNNTLSSNGRKDRHIDINQALKTDEKMHEAIIASKILKEARKKAKGKKIKSILLEVGELAILPADELKEALQVLADFEIIIKPTNAIVKCMCGYEGEPRIIAHEHDLVLFECLKCGKIPRALKGNDIVLKEINTS